jgi:hypothetical protein
MSTQPLHAVKRGNLRSTATGLGDTMDWTHRGCRPQAQYEAVLAHFRRHPAAWVCGDPFKQERPGQRFRCGFLLSYFDLEGRMCSLWVEPSGKIEFSRDATPNELAAKQALEVVRKHGLFRGGN